MAPTVVRGKHREFIRDVQLTEFELYDNNRLQKITADVSEEPISMVVAIQRSRYLESALRKSQKIGSLLNDLVAGENGEVAVIGFDHEIQLAQDFTSESARVSAAIKNMTPGSRDHALVQAVTDATRMLSDRPINRQRVLLLISERRDKGSKGTLRDALESAQAANVTIYALDVTTVVAFSSKKAQQPPPSLPTTAQHIPAGGALTPTTIDQNYYNGNYIPAFVELFHGIKNVFVDDALDMLTHFTGGRQYSFISDSSLENAVQNMSEELHNQYLLSYVPNNLSEPGFHEIKVAVRRPEVETRTRPGYWSPTKPE